MGENLPARRAQGGLQPFEPVEYPTQGEISPAGRAPSPPAPRPVWRGGGVARVSAAIPATASPSDAERDEKPVSIGQITATNVTIHVHGTTIQQHQEVVYGDRISAVAQSPPPPPRSPNDRTPREPLGGLALIGVLALALVGAAFLAGCAWHAITARTPSVIIEEREPRSFVDYLKERGRE
jgi:hypothetical protein